MKGIIQKNFIHEIIYQNTVEDGAYVVNLDECKSIGAHWIALYVNESSVIYFDSFGVEDIPKEIKKLLETKI